jgi:choline dehydrogenase
LYITIVSNNISPNAGTLDSNATYNAEQRALYELSRKGPYVIAKTLSTNLALPPLCNATSSCKEIVTTARQKPADTYLAPGTDPSVVAGYAAQREEILRQLEGQDTPIGMIHWGTSTTVTLYFLKPLSRGSIAIDSTNPLTPPLIDFRSMTDPADFELFIALFRKNREIMRAREMAALGPREAAPFGEDVTDFKTLKELFRSGVGPSNAHQCCTAAMVPLEQGGVVDTEMRVYGIQGLRVVDVSYWPMVLTAAPTGTTYASGEKVGCILSHALSNLLTLLPNRLRILLRRLIAWPIPVLRILS